MMFSNIDIVQDEKDILQNIGCCFEGFCRHKCWCINCLVLLTFFLFISTLIAMALSAILLGALEIYKKIFVVQFKD
jgi:hypothetical protein